MKALSAVLSLILLAGFTSSLMSRERYDLLKSEASFDVIEYEEYLEIFQNKDFEQSRIGESNYQEELAYLETADVEFVSSENMEGGEVRQLFGFPESYDTRTVFPKCFEDIVRDQENCGGCW
jgi:hypothetical protein